MNKKGIVQHSLLAISLVMLIQACNTTITDNKEVTKIDSTPKNFNDTKQNTVEYYPNNSIWEYQFDSVLNDFKLVKLRQLNKDTLTINAIINIANRTWPKVQIEFIKISNDTIYIDIPNSKFLSQQMGSSGATAFMVSTTYSLTELKGIHFVSYHFEVGDHANPGVYNRSSWK